MKMNSQNFIKNIMFFSFFFSILFGCKNTTEPPTVQPIKPIPKDVYPDWCPTGEWIAYQHDAIDIHNDTGGIYLVKTDGTNKHLIIPGGEGPSWSPDGEKIAFAAPLGDGQIWIYNVNSKTFHRLTNEGFNIEPDWSNKGNKIAYTTGIGTSDIIISDTNGVKLTNINFAMYPSWSPTDDSICYLGKNSTLTILKILDLSFKEFLIVNTFDWNPFTNEIVYALYDYDLHRSEISIYDFLINKEKKLNINNGYNPSWSSDGEKIVYSSNIGDKVILCIINKDGSNNKQITF